jgi:ubiquinone/menaquinone biosynthesis C-methylase UbiE
MPRTPDTYSHGHHESVLRSHRWRTAENSAGFILDRLGHVETLLDVGCGPGNITADLARHARAGRVTGIDRSPDVIEAARRDHAADNLTFEVGDVYDLAFDDETFDLVYVHQVLQHLSDPVRALAEMRRVVKRGGVVAARDADYAAFAWAPSDPVLDRWMDLYHQITSHNHAEADAGRHLPAWARAAGFTDVEVSSSTWTYATPDEREWWGGLWADRVRESEFARQSVEYGYSNPTELEEIAEAFRRWAAAKDGVFILVHGEVIARR